MRASSDSLKMQNKTYSIIFSHYGTIDGGEACGFTRSFQLASSLAKIGNKIYFLTLQKKGFQFPYKKEIRNGVNIYAFPEILPYFLRKGGFGTISLFLKVIFVFLKKADIVHSDMGHRPNSGLICLLHRKIHKSKYFSEWWEHFGTGGIFDDLSLWKQQTIGRLDNILEVFFRVTADGCLPISTKLYERALENQIPYKNLLILNGGSDTSNILYNNDSTTHKKKFNIPDNCFVIGYIGINDSEFKSNIKLFKAINEFNLESKKIVFVATGKVSDQLISEYQLDKSQFIIFNWLPYNEFVELITSIDLFTLIQKNCLRNESRFPNKLGDYLATGRPVLANRIGEVEIYAKKYPSAFYLIDNQKEDLEESLLKAYDDWKNKKVDYQKIRKIAENNSWVNRAKKLNKFYTKICNN